MGTIYAMDIDHDLDVSGLDDPAYSIHHSAFANPHALDLAYRRWNSLCTVNLVRFLQTLTSTDVDQLTKSEEMLQQEFAAYLFHDLMLSQDARFLSLRQEPADTWNYASGSTPSVHSDRSVSSKLSTSSVSSQVSDAKATNRIQQEVKMLIDLVESLRKQLNRLEGASGALRKNRPIKFLTIPEPEVAKLPEIEKQLRNRLLAASELQQVLLDAEEKLAFLWIDAEDLGFSNIDGPIRQHRSGLEEYAKELDDMSTLRSFLGHSMKWSKIKMYLSELGSPSRDKSKSLKLYLKLKGRPADKKTIEDRTNRKKEDLIIRQSRYSAMTRVVTEILADITKKFEEAKEQKNVFLATGRSIASITILECAAKAGYSKEDVFENGILVQRHFSRKVKKL